MAKRYALVVDMERCIGCHACTIACKVENNPAAGSWIRVETVGGQMDTAQGRYPDLTMRYLPRLCLHCAQPACQPACPREAISRREDGIVLVDADKCDGCQACVPACPYDALSLDARGIVEKCTLCVHRVDQGLEPFCVVCCEMEAMHFGDLNNPDDATAQLLARRQDYPIVPKPEGETSVRYTGSLAPRRL